MGYLLATICWLTLLLSPQVRTARQDAILLGADMRPIDVAMRATVVQILDYRVRTRKAIEPLLIFSPLSDPDILGTIATDRTLALPIREIAANAILDQLYLASPYFQIGSEYYLRSLVGADERSLRLKGWIGLAIMEYWYFFTERPGVQEPKRLFTLQYAASLERDPSLRQVFDQLSQGEPSDILGSAAWSPSIAATKPYRQFDTALPAALNEAESPGPPVAAAWSQYREALALTQRFANERLTDVNLSKIAVQHFSELEKADDKLLQGYLARYNAFTPSHELTATYPPQFIVFFKDLVKRKSDPWLRSLAVAPLTHAPRAESTALFIDVMNKDQSALVRLTSVDLLRHFATDQAVRDAIINAYRTEDDARVRKRMLHSLLWPFADRPTPDLIAFLSRLLQQERNEEVLEFVVANLAQARARNVTGIFSALLASSKSVTLRARIADALAILGAGTRSRSLERIPQ